MGIFRKSNVIGPKIKPNSGTGHFGNIDFCNREGVAGWVIDISRPLIPLKVNAYLNNHLVGSATCDQIRADIVSLTGVNAKTGFFLRWNNCFLTDELEELPEDSSCTVEIRLADDGRMIASSTKILKIEDVRSWISGVDPLERKQAKSLQGRMVLTPKEVATYLDAMPGQSVEPIAREGDVKLIAYYLPQFHPIPENDEWWGAGFTEWTNVAQAMPYYKGHYQPHIPGELGYYDLRLPEIREAQAKLAREHGIYGFCYYYYWFSGRRILERPLQEVLDSGKPDFPFCICWANENWSRRWDGSENEILLQQIHNQETDEEFIHDVIPLFKDPRYIRLNGAPLLIVYRLSLMPDPKKTVETWRRICAEEGIPELHLCMAETFGLTEPRQFGFDSAVQFPPHNTVAGLENNNIPDLAEGYTGNIYDIEAVIRDQLSRESPTYNRFPGVMTSWDNTARKKKAGNVFLNSSPDNYEIWLRGAIDQARERLPKGEQLVFINAWNEWAEGAHLEPDRKHGRAYLEATRRALAGTSDWRTVLEYAEAKSSLEGETKKNFLAEIRTRLERQSIVNQHMLWLLGDMGMPKQWVTLKPGMPYWMEGIQVVERGSSHMDQLNHYHAPGPSVVGVDSSQKLYLYGWAVCSGVKVEKNTPSYMVLKHSEDPEHTYFALISGRVERGDIPETFQNIARESTQYSGIKTLVDISNIQPGTYRLGVAARGDGLVAITYFETEVEIV